MTLWEHVISAEEQIRLAMGEKDQKLQWYRLRKAREFLAKAKVQIGAPEEVDERCGYGAISTVASDTP